jgi:hypothetical protein
MAFSEKGGLKGSIDLLPLDQIAQTLLNCYQARADIKGQIYEITGISDIIRGQSAASETATAQQIKGQYAGLRLRSMQEDVALFASELIRLKAQVMCAKFQPQTILSYAAAQQMAEVDQQMIPQALQLMQDRPLRNFRVEIAADSLVQIDENQMKQDRLQFIQAFGGFLQQALPVGQASPQLVPVMMELMKFGTQAFKASRPIEGQIDVAMEQLKQAAEQPKPNPEAEAASAQMQAEQQRAQAEMQMEQQKAQLELQLKAQELQQKEQLERFKAELDAATKIMVARISANPGMDVPMLEQQQAVTERVAQDVGTSVQATMQQLVGLYQNLMDTQAQNMAGIRAALAQLAAPKRIVRGPDGRAAGVEIAPAVPVAQPPMTRQ